MPLPRTTFRQRLVVYLTLPVLFGAGMWKCVTNPVPKATPRESLPAVSAELLRKHVVALAGPPEARSESNPQALAAAATYIRSTFASFGSTMEEQPYTVGTRTFVNLTTSFGPKDGERIVIGAHYDVCGERPGADDNASGVAGLIELGRLLASKAPTKRVDLVAWSTEEPPYFGTNDMGSWHHAQALKAADVKVSLALSLEMIGYFSDEPGSQTFPSPLMGALYPTTGNYIVLIGRMSESELVARVKPLMQASTPLPIYSANLPALVPGVDYSDHRSYWEVGYPALMVTDTAFQRNRNYHKSTDTPDTLDYLRMAQVVQGVYGAAAGF